MPQVQRIDPIVLPGARERVAAYCRVSTDSADQMNSYHTQITYYTKLIGDNPQWELADIYADAGITGTSIEKRDEFKRMIADCREGKIQRVLVKSISRFARNTTELLETTRELKELGVVVVFEEQGFDTSQMMGEMLLTMQAMAAQEESNSISKNVRWSIQKRMAAGTFIGNQAPFGYKFENGTLVENEDSDIVRRIFHMYLSGHGMAQIAKHLNAMCGQKQHWGRTTVAWILKNERYVGDALLQKRYRTSTVPYTRKLNKGEVPQYYIQNNHVGLISRDDFDRCQQLLALREQSKNVQLGHLFTHHIMCPICNHHFRQVTCNKKSYWVCPQKEKEQGKHKTCRLMENSLIFSALNMMSKLYIYHDDIISPTIAHLREIEYSHTGSDSKLYELDKSIAALSDKALMLQKLNSKGFISANEYRLRSEKLSAERQKLTVARNRKLNGLRSHSAIEKLEELQAVLSAWPGVPTEFDIGQFDEVVEKIIPTVNNTLIFRLHCGLELTEVIPE